MSHGSLNLTWSKSLDPEDVDLEWPEIANSHGFTNKSLTKRMCFEIQDWTMAALAVWDGCSGAWENMLWVSMVCILLLWSFAVKVSLLCSDFPRHLRHTSIPPKRHAVCEGLANTKPLPISLFLWDHQNTCNKSRQLQCPSADWRLDPW